MLIIFFVKYFLLLGCIVKSIERDVMLFVVNRKYFKKYGNSL